MQLLYSNPLPNPEFVSLSLLVKQAPAEKNVSSNGEPLLLAAPASTLSYASATASLQELHKYLQSLLTSFAPANTSSSPFDRMVSELMQEDEQRLEDMQIFRPLRTHGVALHYKLIRDPKTIPHYSSLILAAAKAAAGADLATRKIEANLAGVLVCVGLSGLPLAHCSSSLQYGLSQRISDCLEVLLQRIGSIDVAAAKTLLASLLVTEDECRKTNEVADSANVTAIPESGDDQSAGLSILNTKKSRSVLKSTKRIATLGLLNRGDAGEASIHVALSSSSADLARFVIQQMTVLSVAENDTSLRQYETPGQQRKANLDLAGNKSRFVKARKRKPEAAVNADLDNFDYKGPTRVGKPATQRKPSFQPRASSNDPSATAWSHSGSALKPPTKTGLRQHKGDAARRNKAVPTLNAPRSDGSAGSRRAPTGGLRMKDFSQASFEDDMKGSFQHQTSPPPPPPPPPPGKPRSRGSRRSVSTESLTLPGSEMTPTEAISETSRAAGGGTPVRLHVNIALNEDLTCSYKLSKLSSCSVEGVIQVQVKSSSRNSVPFQLVMRDGSRHVQLVQENKKYAEDTSEDASDPAERRFVVTVPKTDSYFPLIRYKCSSDLRPVPIRVQTRVKADSGFCRVALQISSNPHNEGTLSDLTIIMGVANDIRGESLVTQPAGGVWNVTKRSVIWCVSELGDGEKFQLQARFEMDPEAAPSRDQDETPKFPVLVRCQCMYSQLSDVEVEALDLPDVYPSEVALKVARRFRLSHQERS